MRKRRVTWPHLINAETPCGRTRSRLPLSQQTYVRRTREGLNRQDLIPQLNPGERGQLVYRGQGANT